MVSNISRLYHAYTLTLLLVDCRDMSLVEFSTTKFRAKQINKVLQEDLLDGITNQDINKRLLESVQDNERAFKVYVTYTIKPDLVQLEAEIKTRK